MQFTVNPHRFDPYKGFKFRVIWDGRPVAGVDRVSALRRSTEVVQHRDGADTSTVRRSPGRTTFDPITLSRGVTHDPAFEQWANKSWNVGSAVGLPGGLVVQPGHLLPSGLTIATPAIDICVARACRFRSRRGCCLRPGTGPGSMADLAIDGPRACRRAGGVRRH